MEVTKAKSNSEFVGHGRRVCKVIFQQTFIEQPHLPGLRIGTVPALMVLDIDRSPVERPGVGGWDNGRYKGHKKLSFFEQKPRHVSGGLNLSCPLN